MKTSMALVKMANDIEISIIKESGEIMQYVAYHIMVEKQL
jgi:hypothetical protein